MKDMKNEYGKNKSMNFSEKSQEPKNAHVAMTVTPRDISQLNALSKPITETVSKLYSYELELHGSRFKVVTDSDAVKMVLNKKDINSRTSWTTKWALVLENYDYTVEHRAGKQMQHDDALSGCTSIMIIDKNTFEHNFAIAQDFDPVLKDLKSELEVEESNGQKWFNISKS
ncbi:hypothetical protein TcasGA2_TC001912 [Tribolium castaneum]|uniref:Reverse transcriptase RNase H-like domain-containing protein n=1 Tax=Tribolium castaneum TaxID=7070 RepID=D7EL99_TRICA|nr:hypothetical protein TcasGA2_TC001912 [Tribolium castaneum]